MTDDTTVRLVAWTCCALLLLSPAAAAGVDCTMVNVSPVADFEYGVVPAEIAPIMVNFYSTSKGGKVGGTPVSDPIESYLWRFGDGSVSEQSNPLHTYATSSARYQAPDKPLTVTLVVTTGCGRVASSTKNVSVYCLNHTAGFIITRPAGDGPYPAPIALDIRDESLHVDDSVTTWHYTVWDAGMTRLFLESTEKDPTFIIRNRGSYVIRQEIFKGCSDPAFANTQIIKNIEVSGSASADAIPMETLPFTTTVPEYPAPKETPAPAAPAPRTTTPAPPPVESLPGTSTLSVVTSPDGARVFVDDVLYGKSPATVQDLAAGPHTLRLEKSGYRNKTVHIEIGDGRVTEYTTVLETESGGPGIVAILVAVIVIAAGAGAAYWYMKKKKPAKPDWNKPD